MRKINRWYIINWYITINIIKITIKIITTLIQRNSTISTNKSQIFITYSNNQQDILIQLIEWEVSITFHNNLLIKFSLILIPSIFIPQIKITNDNYDDCIFNISTEDKTTNNQNTNTNNKWKLNKE